MSEVLETKSAQDFINLVPEHQANAFPGLEFGSVASLIEKTHYLTIRQTVKKPISGFKSCAYTHNGFPFFWSPSPDNFEVTTIFNYGLWEFPPELTGILTTATTLLRLLENYEDNNIPEETAESMMDQYRGLISDGRHIASKTGYGSAFAEILD